MKRPRSQSGPPAPEREPVLLDGRRPAAPAGTAPPQGVGATLREARLRSRRDLADVARALNLPEASLKAIEDGRFRELPGPTYAIGFVRSYAAHVGLDTKAAVAAARDEIRHDPGRSTLAFPAASGGGGVPGRSLLVASAVLVAVVYGGWYYVTQPQGELDLIPPVPERLSALTGAQPDEPAAPPSASNTDPATALGEIAPAAGTPTGSVPAAPTEPALAAPGGASAVAAPTGASMAAVADRKPLPADAGSGFPSAAAEPAVEPLDVPSNAPAPMVAALEDDAPPPIPQSTQQPPRASDAYVPQVFGAPYGTTRVTLVASDESWVQVRGPGDELLLTRLLRPGDKYVVPDRTDLTLVTGNAGALSVVVDGQALPSLGDRGEVVRGISLDATRLLAGTARER